MLMVVTIILNLLIQACSSGYNNANKPLNHLPKTSKNVVTTHLIDSAFILQYCHTLNVSSTLQLQVLQFYALNNYNSAWVDNDTLTNIAKAYYSRLQQHSVLLGTSKLKHNALDTLLTQYLLSKSIPNNTIPILDVQFTITYLLTQPVMYGGYISTPSTLKWYIPKPIINYVQLLHSLVSNKMKTSTTAYDLLLNQLQLYTNLKLNYTQPIFNFKVDSIVVDSSVVQYKQLKQYLFLLQDYSSTDTSTLGTPALITAIKSFQYRMGIDSTGKLNALTINQLNIPLEARINTIKINLERMRWLPPIYNGILVNIADYNLQVMANDKPVWYSKVIVGSVSKKSVIFTANLTQVILNPYWNIPRSIVNNEINGKLRRNPNYLRNNNMEYSNGNIRQKPGSDNALGDVKFIFPNPYNIYLHDTPTKLLFNQTNRALSHGCIRVYNPMYLAQYLLQHYSSFDLALLDSVMATHQETPIHVTSTYPVYIAYFTSWVAGNGKLHFANDIYHYDAPLALAMANHSIK